MVLCEGHCTWIKPAVDNLRYPLHCLAALRTLALDLIDIRPVKLNCLCLGISGEFLKLLAGADSFLMSAVCTLPDIERCTPVTVSGNTPILNIFKPVAETAFTYACGDPVNSLIVCNQVIPYCCHLDKPGLSCIVKKRSRASPAVRIIMLNLRCREKDISRIKLF